MRDGPPGNRATMGRFQPVPGSAEELLAAVDWDAHPLGPRSGWPAALAVAVNIVLASPESMYLVWGAERTFFFNTAYIPILGPRLPVAMGARFEELWADAWPSVAPAFLEAEAGTSTRFVDAPVPMARYGVPEDTWWTFSFSPVRDETGAVRGVLCMTRETTADVLREQARTRAVRQQEILNRELSHRVKNTMTMVQAIASQTLKKVTERDAVKAFQDRLVALGKAHDVLLHNDWQAASITAIVESVLTVHAGREQWSAEGPEVFLDSSATLSLSLLLHELATNALKYGALSVPGGHVDLRWEIAEGQPERDFVLSWSERDGPVVTPPDRKGFGSRLIGLGLCGTGNAELCYEPTGLRATFAAPLSRLMQAQDVHSADGDPS